MTALALIGGIAVLLPGPNASSAASPIPSAPTSVTATASDTSTLVTVSWTLPSSGPRPDRIVVVASQGLLPVGHVVCTAPICSSVWIPGLTAGQSYTFSVQAGVAAGYSAPTFSHAVKVNAGCQVAKVCVVADATAPEGATQHVAAGLLHGAESTTPTALLAPLDVEYWRTTLGAAGCTSTSCMNYADYDTEKVLDPISSTTAVLSDAWYNETYLPFRECANLLQCVATGASLPYGGVATPWSNWGTYDTFITSTVQTVVASGRSVNYWDLVNEPPAQGPLNDLYLDFDSSAAVTTADLEQWLLHTYDDVKAADPSAQVVCPSLEGYDDYPGEAPANSQLLDFSTFLAFAAANHMDCSAFSWHEINTTGSATDFNMQPEDIVAHVFRFRQLLAQYPQFQNAQIFINEYGAFTPALGTQAYESMPGWSVGYIAALEQAGVNEANRSCTPGKGCADLLDDLLVHSGNTFAPSHAYWPYWFYAQMNGTVVPVTSSAEQVSGFAALDTARRTLRILLGRHEVQLTGNPNGESASIAVTVPWSTGSVQVQLQSFANGSGAEFEPPITTSTVPVIDGTATITLPNLGPENAYGITVTPLS